MRQSCRIGVFFGSHGSALTSIPKKFALLIEYGKFFAWTDQNWFSKHNLLLFIGEAT